MLNKDTLVKVKNRSNGTVSYRIPDLGNLRRYYEIGETKEVTVEEVEKLSAIQGGYELLKDYLMIEDEELANKVLNHIEPEYYYTEEDVKNLLLNGSVDQLDDCLTFGGEAIVNLVKKYAVELKIADLNKRNLIKDKTGFNVSAAVTINEETVDEHPEAIEKTRKATPITAKASTSARKADPVIIKK